MGSTDSTADSRRLAAAIGRHGRRIHLTSGQYVFTEGDSSNHVYALIEGQIRIVRALRSGRQLLLGVKEPGSEFGELSALDGARRTASAVADSPSVVSRVSSRRFNELMLADTELSIAVTHRLAAQLREANERLRARNSDSTFTRAGHQLVELAVLVVKHGGTAGRIELAITQRDLADWIGATRESTARALARLRRSGLVETSRGRIVVTDVAALTGLIDQGSAGAVL